MLFVLDKLPQNIPTQQHLWAYLSQHRLLDIDGISLVILDIYLYLDVC